VPEADVRYIFQFFADMDTDVSVSREDYITATLLALGHARWPTNKYSTGEYDEGNLKVIISALQETAPSLCKLTAALNSAWAYRGRFRCFN